jgi:hypothetical protein
MGKLQKRGWMHCLYNFILYTVDWESVPQHSDLKWTQYGRPDGGWVSSINEMITELLWGKSVPVPIWVPNIPHIIMAYATIPWLGECCTERKTDALKVTMLLIFLIVGPSILQYHFKMTNRCVKWVVDFNKVFHWTDHSPYTPTTQTLLE